MEFLKVLKARRMVRAFTDEPVPAAVIDGLCDLARRAPSAGNSQATEFLVLDRPEAVRRYWDTTLPAPRRDGFRWPGLLRAPVLVLVVVRPDAYLERYAEPDKAPSGLGERTDAWPVPYWWVDAGAAVEHVLLGVVDHALGACLFGAFEHEAAIASAFSVPADRRLVATIAIGCADAGADEPGRSSGRTRPPIGEIVHRNTW